MTSMMEIRCLDRCRQSELLQHKYCRSNGKQKHTKIARFFFSLAIAPFWLESRRVDSRVRHFSTFLEIYTWNR